jgi:hypothetical protein
MKRKKIMTLIEEMKQSRLSKYPLGTREILVRITEAKPREVFYLSYLADSGEVFNEQLVLPRDLPRLEALREAVGWWVPTLTWEKVGLLLDSEGKILGYIPAILIDPSAVDLFPWSWLRPKR